MKTSRRLATSVACLALLSLQAVPAFAQDAEEVIAVAKAQWVAENAHKPVSEAWASIADDYTEFNGEMPTLVKGTALAGKFYDVDPKTTGKVSEMLNPNVQFYGDTAILTYNYAGVTHTSEGKYTTDLAKSTRVYVKQGGKWMLVHANFAPFVPAD